METFENLDVGETEKRSLIRLVWQICNRHQGKILHIIERILLCIEIAEKISRLS